MTGIWQVVGNAPATEEEATAVVSELLARNISSVSLRALPGKIRVREEEEAAEQKRKVLSGAMWGGMGLGMVALMIYALK